MLGSSREPSDKPRADPTKGTKRLASTWSPDHDQGVIAQTSTPSAQDYQLLIPSPPTLPIGGYHQCDVACRCCAIGQRHCCHPPAKPALPLPAPACRNPAADQQPAHPNGHRCRKDRCRCHPDVTARCNDAAMPPKSMLSLPSPSILKEICHRGK
jgi:hypothetical protein